MREWKGQQGSRRLCAVAPLSLVLFLSKCQNIFCWVWAQNDFLSFFLFSFHLSFFLSSSFLSFFLSFFYFSPCHWRELCGEFCGENYNNILIYFRNYHMMYLLLHHHCTIVTILWSFSACWNFLKLFAHLSQKTRDLILSCCVVLLSCSPICPAFHHTALHPPVLDVPPLYLLPTFSPLSLLCATFFFFPPHSFLFWAGAEAHETHLSSSLRLGSAAMRCHRWSCLSSFSLPL